MYANVNCIVMVGAVLLSISTHVPIYKPYDVQIQAAFQAIAGPSGKISRKNVKQAIRKVTNEILTDEEVELLLLEASTEDDLDMDAFSRLLL